jgi:predicted nucleic acid-binding protein
MKPVVIFDTSGLLSLLNADDSLHAEAVEIGKSTQQTAWQVLLPYEIYAEALNVIGKKQGRKQADAAGAFIISMYDKQQLLFPDSTPYLLGQALAIHRKATGSPSFVDCLVMAYADDYDTPYIFGFDATFRKNGYLLPDTATASANAA